MLHRGKPHPGKRLWFCNKHCGCDVMWNWGYSFRFVFYFPKTLLCSIKYSSALLPASLWWAFQLTAANILLRQSVLFYGCLSLKKKKRSTHFTLHMVTITITWWRPHSPDSGSGFCLIMASYKIGHIYTCFVFFVVFFYLHQAWTRAPLTHLPCNLFFPPFLFTSFLISSNCSFIAWILIVCDSLFFFYCHTIETQRFFM